MIRPPKTSRRKFLFAIPFLPAAMRAVAESHAKALAFEDVRARLSKIKSIKISHHAKGSSPKIVIVMKDYHGGNDKGFGWRINYDVLKEIRRRIPIDKVGIEGWAGAAADKQRGFVLLNGEKSLIEKLHKDKLPLIGLEDKRLQEIVLEEKLWNMYLTMKAVESIAGKNLDKEKAAQLNKYLGANRKMVSDYAKDLHVPLTENGMAAVRMKLLEYYGEIYENMGEYNSWWLKHDNRVNIVGRSKAAANKLVSDMDRSGHNTAVMVFGANHEQSIIGELKRHGVTVISIGIPREEAAFQKSKADTFKGLFRK